MIDATPLLGIYARYRTRQLQRQIPAQTQEAQLLRLLKHAANTRFGRDHHFEHIGSIAQFQKRVPLRRFEEFWSDYWQAPFPRLIDSTWPGTIPFFAITSGTTTGKNKYIPCSKEMIASNRKAGLDILVHHLNNHPQSHVLGGKSFMLGGSTALVEEARGIRSGDLSGIVATQVPWWARSRFFPPQELALIDDWEDKIEQLATLSLEKNIRMLAGTPSWLLVFIDKLATLSSARRLVDYYPNLEVIVHGAVNFAPYRKRFQELLEGSHAETREVYAASEGFVALADRGDGEGLRLILDNGIFYEFVPVAELDSPSPTRHWIDNAEVDVNYAIVVTCCAGLWSYVLGDTVKLVSLDPPRLLITGRTSYMLSAFGEHLIDVEIEEAIAAAAEAIEATVSDYSVAPIYPENPGDVGRHLYLVEFAGERPEQERMAQFATLLDELLLATNDDYKAHRSDGFGMASPMVQAVTPGTFAAWMKSRGQLGGQHKVPRIILDAELFQGLREFVARH